jgi:hypothetical protein
MPTTTVGRRYLWLLPGYLMLVAIVACGGAPGNHPSGGATSTSTASPLVTGRSIKPTDTKAPGIQLRSGDFSFTIGNYNVVITASDWNTITGSSQVANLVGVEFSPNFNTDASTRNRFQYLADKISLRYRGTNFEPLTIVEGVIDKDLVDIVALYNPTSQVGTLSGLAVTIAAQPSLRTVASATFYATPSSALVIPARTIYFTRLTFPNVASLGSAHNGARSFVTDFHYRQIKFTPCPGQVCPSRNGS